MLPMPSQAKSRHTKNPPVSFMMPRQSQAKSKQQGHSTCFLVWTRQRHQNLDTSWTRFGHVLDTSWTRLGHVLDTQANLDTSWTRLGHGHKRYVTILDTGFLGASRGPKCARGDRKSILDTSWTRAPLSRMSKNLGHVF